MMHNDFTVLATAFGATGTGVTYWLTQINPYLAFISGILTIVFMSMGIYKRLTQKPTSPEKQKRKRTSKKEIRRPYL